MAQRKYHIGIIGLGVMGRNLALNIADQGFSVVGYDKKKSKVGSLNHEGRDHPVEGVRTLEEFISLLEVPRSVLLLVPSGDAVDAVIRELIPHLQKGDLIIDGGNSHFTETNRRIKMLDEKGLQFLGIGISGGEKGARFGPSMMPGGHQTAYNRIRDIFEKAAAKVQDEPCVTYLGPGSAGHYVKMVHNGIEYGFMQLISETYHLLRLGVGANNDDLHFVYKNWNQHELQSYLLEITAQIFLQNDEMTGERLIGLIKDQAKEKGTGKWTSQDAMELQVPVPNIDIAVAMRDMSDYKMEREEASRILSGPVSDFTGDRNEFINRLRSALYFALITTFAQGMALLRVASDRYSYHLKLQDIARIWRGGCIIRAGLLEDVRSAFENQPNLPNLLLDPYISDKLAQRQDDLRFVIHSAIEWGIPVPGMMAALAYFDSYRSAWLPANLIQAQRDFFGSHTYERVDEEGTFHTQWNEGQGE